ncbi:HipA domain-containing protein [Lysinibacillus sp. NPDC059133]|uniref:HipA domain-containing protein n=1 Tax=Lysinibacillus sp. NPDC059133 TaxID=3346737 RepID=UPI00367BC975
MGEIQLRDISTWERIGYGGKSTLEKEELIAPSTNEKYLIKYPRQFQVGVSWEDITELIAADIGELIGLRMMDVEIVLRHEKRGSLLKNFIPNNVMNEEGGALLSMLDGYEEFINSSLKGHELIEQGFHFIKQLYFWEQIKEDFINMNYFDILIGNQDRHPYNWLILFESTKKQTFSPIYDNGASLGFRFDDSQLVNHIKDNLLLEKYIRKSTVKAGLFEKKKVQASEMIQYLNMHYKQESEPIIKRIKSFDFHQFYKKIEVYDILSNTQKEWLKLIVSHRRESILKWLREEE